MQSPLYECNQCILARGRSNAREVAHEHIVTYSQYLDHTHGVYVTYGAGGLAFDARCLHDMLNTPWQHITIVIIDPLYQAMISWLTQHHGYVSGKHIRATSRTDTPEEIEHQLHRCRFFMDYVEQAATTADIHFFFVADAQTYYQMTHSNARLKADICTWIDPDVAITPHDPFADQDAQYIPACLAERAHVCILTIDNEQLPTLITEQREAGIIQHTHTHITDNRVQSAISAHGMPVYPYDPIPQAITIDDNVYTPTIFPYAVRFLHHLCHGLDLDHMCIPHYVRSELAALAEDAAPGCTR